MANGMIDMKYRINQTKYVEIWA